VDVWDRGLSFFGNKKGQLTSIIIFF